jgi:hypothetical protein
MHYLCLVYRQENDANEHDTQVETRALVEALVESGYDIAGFPLAPPAEATTLRRTGDGLVLLDGPVTTGSARLQTVYVLKARDLNDAVRLAAWLPEASSAEVEIRPIRERPPNSNESPLPEKPPTHSMSANDESVPVAG